METNWHNVQREFMWLRGYLAETLRNPRMLKMELWQSLSEDTRNKKDPRGFASTIKGECSVQVARAIAALPSKCRIAILLHELIHQHLNAFYGERAEVEVDTFIVKTFGWLNYHYDDVTYSYDGIERVAHSLQCVKPRFGGKGK